MLRSKFKKSIISLLLITTFLGSSSAVQAQALDEEANAAASWEDTSTSSLKNSATSSARYEDAWILQDTKNVAVTGGTITLSSYTMTLLNDTKLCKAVTTHIGYFRGYARARFETITGVVYAGSDSGRIYSHYGATAITPDNPSTTGWTGIAHTYCGTD